MVASLRLKLTYIVIAAQLLTPFHGVMAMPDQVKGTQPPTTEEAAKPLLPGQADPAAMTTSEAQAIIQEADKTAVVDAVGAAPAIPAEKLQNFREKFSRVIDANTKIGLVPGKFAFLKFWKKNEKAVVGEARKKKISIQRMLVGAVAISLLASVNNSMDLIPVTYWLDSNIQNPTLKAASSGSVDALVATGNFIVSAANTFSTQVQNNIVTTLMVVVAGAPISAWISQPQNVLNQKLTQWGGRSFSSFSSWLAAALERTEMRVTKVTQTIVNMNRKLKGLPPVSEDVIDNVDDTTTQISAADLTATQKIQRLLRATGITISLTTRNFTDYITNKKTVWNDYQQMILNEMTERQRNGRGNMWEAVYYSPQHFTGIIRAALSQADSSYENALKARDRLIKAAKKSDQAEVKSILAAIKADAQAIHKTEIADPATAAQHRQNLQAARARLAELGADEEDVKHYVDRSFRYIKMRHEAVANLVIFIKRDIDYVTFNSQLPDEALEELVKVRRELGLDYYMSELNEELVALAEEFNLEIKAYENISLMYKRMRSNIESKQKESRSRRAKAAAASQPSAIATTCDATLRK